MRSLSVLSVALLAGLALVAAGCGGSTKSSTDVPSAAAAVVGKDTISKAELDRTMASTKNRYIAANRTFPKVGSKAYVRLRDDALAYLIEQSEFAQKLVDLGAKPVTKQDVDARLAAVKQQVLGAQQSNFQPELKKEGLTVADLRAEIHDELVQDRVFTTITGGTTVTDAELKAAYDRNKTVYVKPSTRLVAHILVPSKALADKIEAQLKNGASFAALAKKYSKDSASAPLGGKIEISQGQSVAEFEQVAFKLKTGEVSDPVQTRYGWHIIKALGDPVQGASTPLSKVAPQLRPTLLKEKKQTIFKNFVAKMRKEFKKTIAYQKGYAPGTKTPASS